MRSADSNRIHYSKGPNSKDIYSLPHSELIQGFHHDIRDLYLLHLKAGSPHGFRVAATGIRALCFLVHIMLGEVRVDFHTLSLSQVPEIPFLEASGKPLFQSYWLELDHMTTTKPLAESD